MFPIHSRWLVFILVALLLLPAACQADSGGEAPPVPPTQVAVASPDPRLATPQTTLADEPLQGPTPPPPPTLTNTPLPTNISTPSATETLLPSTIVPTTLPAPTSLRLLKSPGGTEAQVGQPATFAWDWEGELPENATFVIRMWKDGDQHNEGDHNAYDPGEKHDQIIKRDSNTYQVSFKIAGTYIENAGSSSKFWWTVAVVELGSNRTISPEAQSRFINISNPSSK